MKLVSLLLKYNKLPNWLNHFKIELDQCRKIKVKSNIAFGNGYCTTAFCLKMKMKMVDENKWLLDTTEKWCQDRAI